MGVELFGYVSLVQKGRITKISEKKAIEREERGKLGPARIAAIKEVSIGHSPPKERERLSGVVSGGVFCNVEAIVLPMFPTHLGRRAATSGRRYFFLLSDQQRIPISISFRHHFITGCQSLFCFIICYKRDYIALRNSNSTFPIVIGMRF